MTYNIANPAGYEVIATQGKFISRTGMDRDSQEKNFIYAMWKIRIEIKKNKKTIYTNKRSKISFDFDTPAIYGDCSSTIEAFLGVCCPELLMVIRECAGNIPNGRRLFARDFVTAFTVMENHRKPEHIQSTLCNPHRLKRGDLLAYTYPPGKKSTGHIQMICSKPRRFHPEILDGAATMQILSGRKLYRVAVIHTAGKEGTKPGFSRKTKLFSLKKVKTKEKSLWVLAAIRNGKRRGKFKEYPKIACLRF